jgi:hypothetical protein
MLTLRKLLKLIAVAFFQDLQTPDVFVIVVVVVLESHMCALLDSSYV